MLCRHIVVRGIVQGVGFRPFVYRLARKLRLDGWISNTGSGVEIEIAGSRPQVDAFLNKLRSPPPLAVIEELDIRWSETQVMPGSGFEIRPSETAGRDPGSLPPDADTCPACLKELFDSSNPRYLYPFINCTDCGPRYTVIEKIPYDRGSTTMKSFQLCPDCLREFQDPADRRFHAQTNCCPRCGPHYTLCDRQGNPVPGVGKDAEAIDEAARLIGEGNILAIKGIGGFHLVTDACNQQSVEALRIRKRRPDKPLGVMAAGVGKVLEIAEADALEQRLLCSPFKPIVLLRKGTNYRLAEATAPETVFVGLMLPYSPLHYLLFRDSRLDFLVMTSGNVAGSPIIRQNEAAVEKLQGIADFFLVHDREILISNDDSVVRCKQGATTLLRRSRSYAPAGLALKVDAGKTLAFGAMLKNTLCVTRGKKAFFSHHIGELENPDTAEFLRYSRDHFLQSLRIEPDLVACDLHPQYPSTILAREYSRDKGVPLVQVQHHHAHAVSCMAEHGLDEPVLAVLLDGSGWGDDSTVWGGEVLMMDATGYERIGHLLPVPMPGGDAAALQPWRMALSYLHLAWGGELEGLPLALLQKHIHQIPLLLQMIDKNINCPLTSSCGRLFDALAALLDLCDESSFEGQAASRIEMVADETESKRYPISMMEGDVEVLETGPLIRAVTRDLIGGEDKGKIAARFQNSLAQFFSDVCEKAGRRNGIGKVVLSGGVFQNLMFRNIVRERLDRLGFSVYTQEKVVSGDGGIALGQAVAGRAIHSQSGGIVEKIVL